MKTIRLMTLLALGMLSMTIIVQAQTVIMYPLGATPSYSPKLPLTDMSHAKTELTRILKGMNVLNQKDNHIILPKKVSVFDDRIELTMVKELITYYFSDILTYTIAVCGCEDEKPDGSRGPLYYCKLNLGKFTTYERNRGDAMELADYLFFFQQHLHIQTIQQRNQQRFDSLLTIFKPIAAHYRELKVKPAVSEEQREFIVQANSLNQKKMYDSAIELYNKAIEIDPTAYPAGYSNLALLSAQISKFDAAIYYMKKYLLLEPEASDARSCQDKIYEWKAEIPK